MYLVDVGDEVVHVALLWVWAFIPETLCYLKVVASIWVVGICLGGCVGCRERMRGAEVGKRW